MQSTSLMSSSCCLNLPSLPKAGGGVRKGGGRRGMVVSAGIRRSNSYGSGRQVDEGMLVLRKRIHEMKMVERNYQPPAEWMEWEKQVYTSYDDIVCRGLGVVQSLLVDARPSVAIAALALLAAGVPSSLLLLAMQLASAVGR